MEENKTNGRDEIYSTKVKAGKRTYFFDVKATRSNDYYLTITESKKRFKDALTNTVNHVKTELMPNVDFSQFDHVQEREEAEAATTKSPGVDTELKWE